MWLSDSLTRKNIRIDKMKQPYFKLFSTQENDQPIAYCQILTLIHKN